MPTITIKYLAGVKEVTGRSIEVVDFKEGAALEDLKRYLDDLDIDLDSKKTLLVYNNQGLGQWPSDHKIGDGDELLVFPLISGG